MFGCVCCDEEEEGMMMTRGHRCRGTTRADTIQQTNKQTNKPTPLQLTTHTHTQMDRTVCGLFSLSHTSHTRQFINGRTRSKRPFSSRGKGQYHSCNIILVMDCHSSTSTLTTITSMLCGEISISLDIQCLEHLLFHEACSPVVVSNWYASLA